MQPPTHAARPPPATPAGLDGYSTREVADATGLSADRVRHLARRGLLKPSRGGKGDWRFSFQDMALLRTTQRLLANDVPPREAFAALADLRESLARDGAGKALCALNLTAAGKSVAVRESDGLWDARTGQGQLPFTAPRATGKVYALGQRGAPKGARASHVADAGAGADELDSDDWYNLGLEFEETAPRRAPHAYRRAISLNPANADAHVNLGRLFQVQGDLKRAKRHYQMALHCVPKHQLALYNLGTVFDELDEADSALAYYVQAPDVPDAHYNSARICEMRGDEVACRRHMRRYRGMVEAE